MFRFEYVFSIEMLVIFSSFAVVLSTKHRSNNKQVGQKISFIIQKNASRGAKKVRVFYIFGKVMSSFYSIYGK